MSAEDLRRLGEIVDEMFEAEMAEDDHALEALQEEENKIVNALSPKERYTYRLSIAAAFFASSAQQIDCLVEQNCGSPDPCVKTEHLEEVMYAVSGNAGSELADFLKPRLQ